MTPGKLTEGQKSSDIKNQQQVPDKREKDFTRRPATSHKQIGLKRSERVLFEDRDSLESGDSIIYPSTAPEVRRSVDVVVVDIHNENKGSEPNLAARKLFKQRNKTQDTSPKAASFFKNQRHSKFEQGNAWEIQESVDIIQNFEEAERFSAFPVEPEPRINKVPNSPYKTQSLRKNLDDSSSVESYPQLFGSSEKFIKNSRENSALEGESGDARFTEEPKKRRKRWSKNENNLHLTQELIVESSDTIQSVESNSRCSRPVPAPRRKGFSKSFDQESILAFDNVAFRSDTEEVLRIETEVYEPQGTSDGSQNYRQSTKIEMTNLYDSYEKVVDQKNAVYDSENESISPRISEDSERLSEIESLNLLGLVDKSDEVETEIHQIKKNEDSPIFHTPSKSRKQLSTETALETSEFSEDDEGSDASKKKCEKEKTKRKNRRLSKERSASFDTSNSLTDTSSLPRSKSHREFSRKPESKKRSVRKRMSKRTTKKDSENDLTEYNVNGKQKFTCVTIHKAEVLETDFITRHPMVKVYIVDMKTGNYLKTSHRDNYGKCSYLQPMITRKFDFKENRSIVPNWEEELIFEYNFEKIVQLVDKPILILFEILDLLNFAEASFNYNFLGSDGCWHKIAWAFLRPVGVNGTPHINKKVRLQLYEPCKMSKKSGRLARCEVFNWWQSMTREKYPSTLYVTLKSVDPPIEDPIVYERFSLNELTEIETESRGSCKKSSDLLQLPKWTRVAAQSCKIPNNQLFETETFENGSFYLTFSNSGKYLACVGSEESKYPILVYTIPEGKKYVQFMGHTNFIYSLNWSNGDKYLLSVSSDQTACIWDIENKIIQRIQMLPHPSYVYCGKFYPATKNVVVTGCHDCVARIWTKCKRSKRYELTQELYEHKGYVNALCFQKDRSLITADSLGVIILWMAKKRNGVTSEREWHLLKIIRNNEIENIIINTVVLHPLGSRLLVHTRDNGLRMIDLDTGVVLQRYKGLRNRRLQITACLSPCGGLVFCGGEDSYLTVWSLESARCLAKYIIREAKIVACVAYHPFDHILAFSTFGGISGVTIMDFEKTSTGENVGLSLLENDVVENSDNIEITMKFDKSDLMANMNAGYSSRKTAKVPKHVKRTDLKANTNYGASHKLSKEIGKYTMNENSLSRQDLLRLKIQRLNESEEGLKSRSAARLNNIIEKIDRILVNTTSKQELDSTCSTNDARKQDSVQISSNSRKDSSSKSQDRMRSTSLKSKSKARYSNSNTDATIDLCNTSTEFIELQTISSTRNKTLKNKDLLDLNKKLLHSKSYTNTTKNISLSNNLESEREHSIYNTSSESHRRISSKENKFDEASDMDVESNHERKTKTRRKKGKQVPHSTDEKLVSDSEACIIDLENMKHDLQSNPSTSDSVGTYTIDIDKFAKPWASDKSKLTDTSSSLRSNATFTIENEISAPRSTKKD